MYERFKTSDKVEGYKMTYKFNASHSMQKWVNIHTHTFFVNLYITKDTAKFVEFYEYEKAIINYINKYKGCYLNDLFTEEPTVEFLCMTFFHDISEILDSTEAFTLLSLELGDSPINSVKVGKEIIASRANIHITEEMYSLCKKGLECLDENI